MTSPRPTKRISDDLESERLKAFLAHLRESPFGDLLQGDESIVDVTWWEQSNFYSEKIASLEAELAGAKLLLDRMAIVLEDAASADSSDGEYESRCASCNKSYDHKKDCELMACLLSLRQWKERKK